MAFMFLCHIKSFEQTKHLNLGDWGKMAGWIGADAELLQQIKGVDDKVEKLLQERKAIPCMIPVSQMPPESHYNKLRQEGKHLMNIVKMVCYRSETALANL